MEVETMNEDEREARMREFGKQFAAAMFSNKPVRSFVDILPDWAKTPTTKEQPDSLKAEPE